MPKKNDDTKYKTKILLLDDEAPLSKLLEKRLNKLGYLNIDVANNYDTAFKKYKKDSLVISDFNLKDKQERTGATFKNAILKFDENAYIILSSGTFKISAQNKKGFKDFLPKPYTQDELKEVVEKAMKIIYRTS